MFIPRLPNRTSATQHLYSLVFAQNTLRITVSPHMEEAVLVIAELMTKSLVVMGKKLGWGENDLQHLDLHSSCTDGRYVSLATTLVLLSTRFNSRSYQRWHMFLVSGLPHGVVRLNSDP